MNIKNVIKRHGFTNQQVIDKMGVSKVTFYQYLKTDSPSVTTLRKIAEIIDCDITEFFADEVKHHHPDTEQIDVPVVCPHCGEELHITIGIK